MATKTLKQKKDDNGINYRGIIIEKAIILEKSMEIFIGLYFCESDDEKIGVLQYLILGDNRLNFDSKLEIFTSIAEKFHPEWYNSYVSIRPDLKNVSLKADLKFIMENRNILAHAYMSNEMFFEVKSTNLKTTKEQRDEDEGKVYFNKFINYHKEIPYDAESIKLLKNLAVKISNWIVLKNTAIRKEIRAKEITRIFKEVIFEKGDLN